MELGDGDPEGWPRKGGELFSKQEKSLLPTPHLTPHPEGPGVRAALTPVCPSLWLLFLFPTRPSVSFHSLKQQSEPFSVLSAGVFTTQFHMHYLL